MSNDGPGDGDIDIDGEILMLGLAALILGLSETLGSRDGLGDSEMLGDKLIDGDGAGSIGVGSLKVLSSPFSISCITALH